MVLDVLTQIAQFAQQNWLLLALMAMFFASLANVSLKILVKNQNVLKMDWSALAPVIVLVALALVAGWFFFVQGSGAFEVTPAQFFWMAAFAVLSFGTFACMMFALQSGKVALVTAVLSMSTVLVALISVVFLGEKFEPKQIVAIAFAVISVLLLVL